MHQGIEKLETSVVKKGWGREVVIVNNNLYCGKLLEFKEGAAFSMHMHRNKDETFYVLKGHLVLDYFDLSNADRLKMELFEGDVIRIKPHTPHKILANRDSCILEISTHHEDSDSYRIEKGDSQR